jgi:preprotein translocase subunit YajC
VSNGGIAGLLPLLVLLVLAYMLLIRLPRKRARDISRLQAALSSGDQVMLTSGIFARVVQMADEKIDVEISPGVVVTVHRGAIGQIVHDETDGPVDDDAGDAPADHVDTTAEQQGQPGGTASSAPQIHDSGASSDDASARTDGDSSRGPA